MHTYAIRGTLLNPNFIEYVCNKAWNNPIAQSVILVIINIFILGHFGCVYRGFLKMEGTKQEDEVAVKTLKSLTGKDYKK